MKLATTKIVSGLVNANVEERSSIFPNTTKPNIGRINHKRMTDAIASLRKVRLCKRCKKHTSSIVYGAIETFKAAQLQAMDDLQKRTTVIERQENLIKQISEHVIGEFSITLPLEFQ